MTVIHIIDNLNSGGGVNSFVFDLCLELKKQSINTIIISVLKTNYEDKQVEILKRRGIKIICLNAKNKFSALFKIKKVHTVLKAISKNEFVICNLHLKLGVLIGALGSVGLKNVKCVETYHSLYSKYKLQIKLLSGRISYYIPCSYSAEEEMKERFNIRDDKMICIPNGVRLELKPTARISEKKKRVTKIISVGRLTKQKNLECAINAIACLKKNNISFDIFGDGELKNKLMSIADDKKMENIHFMGNVPRETIYKSLLSCDLVLMPSLWEGLSIFLLESISLGCPMVVSDIPSMRCVFHEEKLADNETFRVCEWGFLVNNSDYHNYANAISFFMDNQNLAAQMSKKAIEISSEYKIENTAKKYISLYKSLDNLA